MSPHFWPLSDGAAQTFGASDAYAFILGSLGFWERRNETLGMDRIPNYMHRKMQMLQFLFYYYYIKER
jgi:hypothetical protein